MHFVFNPLKGAPAARSTANRTACVLLAAAALGGGLAACVPLVVGGVAAGVGGLMVTDRRAAGMQVEDEGIELRSVNRIYNELGDQLHVNVTSYNRVVLLTGEVPRADLVPTIEAMVRTTGNVRSVVNELVVAPKSTLPQRSSDTFITGKVRASLVDAKDISAGSFKVVTERNVVYLMGTVSEREANRATSIARGVDGVRKVVRVFEVLSEQDLARLNVPRPAPVSSDAGQAAPAAEATPGTVVPVPLAPLPPAAPAAVQSNGVVTNPVTSSPLR